MQEVTPKKVALLVVVFCLVLVWNKHEEGPYGFKVGQTYLYADPIQASEQKVVEVGRNYVLFGRVGGKEYKETRMTAEQLAETLKLFELKEEASWYEGWLHKSN